MERYNYWRANPTEEMQTQATANALKGTFMQELGTYGKAWQKFTKEQPGLKWLFPFSHIPVNLMKATYEHTPFAAIKWGKLDSAMHDDIFGKNGGAAQDKAIARMVVGSAVMGYFFNLYMNGQATGSYPLDPKERDSWKNTNKQPNSFLFGDEWVSFDKFGPVGNLARMGADLGHLVEKTSQGWKESDDEMMTKATFQAAHAASRMIIDEVGFQTLANFFDAMSGGGNLPEKGAKMIGYQAATLMPFSSLVRQTASGGLPFTGGALGDPYMRQTRGFIDSLKYNIPGMRETLLPQRDFLGEALPNPQYGNILRSRRATVDLVASEMDRLQIHPAPPQDRIGGVKLPPKLYDEYQVRAGAIARVTLENWVKQPGWDQLLPGVQANIFRTSIQAAHQTAGSIMQVRYPEIIQQGIDNRQRQIRGEKPGVLQERP
jgi:hypothetical protein